MSEHGGQVTVKGKWQDRWQFPPMDLSWPGPVYIGDFQDSNYPPSEDFIGRPPSSMSSDQFITGLTVAPIASQDELLRLQIENLTLQNELLRLKIEREKLRK